MSTAATWPRHPVLAVIVGVFAGGLCIALAEWLGHQWLGAADPLRPETLTTPHFATVLVAWWLGAGVSALVATAWCGGLRRWPGWVAGGLLLAGSVATMLAFPHPAWMVVLALVGMPQATAAAVRSRRLAARP